MLLEALSLDYKLTPDAIIRKVRATQAPVTTAAPRKFTQAVTRVNF